MEIDQATTEAEVDEIVARRMHLGGYYPSIWVHGEERKNFLGCSPLPSEARDQ